MQIIKLIMFLEKSLNLFLYAINGVIKYTTADGIFHLCETMFICVTQWLNYWLWLIYRHTCKVPALIHVTIGCLMIERDYKKFILQDCAGFRKKKVRELVFTYFVFVRTGFFLEGLLSGRTVGKNICFSTISGPARRRDVKEKGACAKDGAACRPRSEEIPRARSAAKKTDRSSK